MDLAKVHHLRQYLIKACFTFGSKIVVVVLFLTGGFNTSPTVSSEQGNKKGSIWECCGIVVRPIATGPASSAATKPLQFHGGRGQHT